MRPELTKPAIVVPWFLHNWAHTGTHRDPRDPLDLARTA